MASHKRPREQGQPEPHAALAGASARVVERQSDLARERLLELVRDAPAHISAALEAQRRGEELGREAQQERGAMAAALKAVLEGQGAAMNLLRYLMLQVRAAGGGAEPHSAARLIRPVARAAAPTRNRAHPSCGGPRAVRRSAC